MEEKGGPYCRLLLVTGHPASGKSTVAHHLARTLRWPLVMKDAIKERLFATVLEAVPESGTALGPATWELFYYALDLVMATGHPVIGEGNFWPLARPRLQALLERHGYHAREIVLEAPPEILSARYLARLGDDNRHAGHVRGILDPVQYIEETVRNPYQPMNLGDRVLHVETRLWRHVDLDALQIFAGTT